MADDAPSLASYAWLTLLAAAASLALTPLMRVVAVRVGAVDHPGPRRVHARPVPRLGGLALLGAVIGAVALAPAVGVDVVALLGAHGWRLGWLLAGVLAITATGTLDDVRGLTPLRKLALQLGAASLALAGGYGLAGVTNPFTGAWVPFGPLGGILTLAWIVGIANAFNLIDGLDGLATGVGLIAAATLFVVSIGEGRADAACGWAILGGALAGFLYFNFSPASVFLGDSGSLLVGYLVAVLALQSLQKGATVVMVAVPVLALGLPIMDVVLAVARRAFVPGDGSILRADRGHIHHRLVGRGWTHRSAVLVLYGVCAGFGAVAFVAVFGQGPVNALVVGVAAVATWVGVRALGPGRPRDGDDG